MYTDAWIISEINQALRARATFAPASINTAQVRAHLGQTHTRADTRRLLLFNTHRVNGTETALAQS